MFFVLLNQKCIIRCDAGLSRFTLNEDGKIYICPAACEFDEYIIGDLNGINFNKQSEIFDNQVYRSNCKECSVKYICGGECLIEYKINKGYNVLMCKYKKSLILLAIYFVNSLKDNQKFVYNKLVVFANEVNLRKRKNKDLELFLNQHPEYTT